MAGKFLQARKGGIPELIQEFAHRREAFHPDGIAVARAFALALSRRPSDGELDALCAHASAHGLPSACRVILNLDETHFVD